MDEESFIGPILPKPQRVLRAVPLAIDDDRRQHHSPAGATQQTISLLSFTVDFDVNKNSHPWPVGFFAGASSGTFTTFSGGTRSRVPYLTKLLQFRSPCSYV